MSSGFDLLKNEVQLGLDGRNAGVPMGFDRLNRYIGIRRRIYTLVFGATGTGKSSFVHNSYILNPFDWYIQEGRKRDFKLKIILFSMERSKSYTLMKWVSRKIFMQYGILLPIGKLMGWLGFEKLTPDEHDMFISCEDYIKELESIVDIIEGAQNPTAIYKYLKNYAENNGKIEQVDAYNKIYHPNKDDEIVIPIIDHIGLTKSEKQQTKKEAVDKVSEYLQNARDLYGYSPVVVAQINRDLSNPIYKKLDNFEPNLDQTKESGRPAEDSDAVVALFEPHRYRTNDKSYEVSKFIDENTGGDYFRKVIILKNTYGESEVGIGMGFHGATGSFKELPKAKNMENFDYQSLFNGIYFLDK